jgi:polysaccharide export outer membrane protein
MKTLRFLSVCLMALCASTIALRAQTASESPLRTSETLKISISGVPGGDQASMAGQTFMVADDGTVSVTYLSNGVRAVGLTPSALARELERAYKAAGIYTKPTINVQRLLGPETRMVVSVGGNVRQPGSCVLRPDLRLLDAINERGGFDDFASKKDVQVMRRGTTKEYDLRNVSRNQQNNVILEPGDSIIVRKSKF